MELQKTFVELRVKAAEEIATYLTGALAMIRTS
jgi:hypothetical protein